MSPPFKARKASVATGFLGDHESIRLEFEDGHGEASCVDMPIDVAGRLLMLLSERVEANRRMQHHFNPDIGTATSRIRHLVASIGVSDFTLASRDGRYELEANAPFGATARLIFPQQQLRSLGEQIMRLMDGSNAQGNHSGSDRTH